MRSTWGARMMRREIKDEKPPTRYAPHATHNERRAGRRDIPPPMTSQALTISAHYTSLTAPTRLRRRHSLRDNECRAIVRACVTEVRRSFISHHSTRRSIAPAVGDIPMGNLPLQSAHTMVCSGGTAGTRANNASLTDVFAHCVPPESRDPGRALARPLHPLCCDPQPSCEVGGSTIATSDRDARARSLRAQQTDGRKTCDYRGKLFTERGT